MAGSGKTQQIIGPRQDGDRLLHSPILQRRNLPQPQQPNIRSDQRQFQHLSGRGQKSIRGVLMRRRQLPGGQRDFVRQRSLMKRRRGMGNPLRQISTQPDSALSI